MPKTTITGLFFLALLPEIAFATAGGGAPGALTSTIDAFFASINSRLQPQTLLTMGNYLVAVAFALTVTWQFIKNLALGASMNAWFGELMQYTAITAIALLLINGVPGGSGNIVTLVDEVIHTIGKQIAFSQYASTGSGSADSPLAPSVQLGNSIALLIDSMGTAVATYWNTTKFFSINVFAIPALVLYALFVKLPVLSILIALLILAGVIIIGAVVFSGFVFALIGVFMPIFVPMLLFKPLEPLFLNWFKVLVAAGFAKLVIFILLDLAIGMLQDIEKVLDVAKEKGAYSGLEGIPLDYATWMTLVALIAVIVVILNKSQGAANGLIGTNVTGFDASDLAALKKRLLTQVQLGKTMGSATSKAASSAGNLIGQATDQIKQAASKRGGP